MIDINSSTWKVLLAYIGEQEKNLVKTLCSEMTEERKTQFIRGQLETIRRLRKLPEIQNISLQT